jgi:hypothetical protein
MKDEGGRMKSKRFLTAALSSLILPPSSFIDIGGY